MTHTYSKVSGHLLVYKIDTLGFRVELENKPLSCHGIISTISSVYDPLGIVSPVILCGKLMLQDLCRQNVDWDDLVPEEIFPRWERWHNKVPLLEDVNIQRCFKPPGFGKVVQYEVHSFWDASQFGIGQVSYLRVVNENKDVHVSFLMSKARVAPIKPMSIPRMDLNISTSVLLCKFRGKFTELNMNVHAESHMGGIWERMIKSVRSVLLVLLQEQGAQLDDETLCTFMTKADNVINSLPLTVECLSDPASPEPITPNHLKNSRMRWRRVQYLANQFWIRWH